MNIFETKDGYKLVDLLINKLSKPKKQYSVQCTGDSLSKYLNEELSHGSKVVSITDITEPGYERKFVVVLEYPEQGYRDNDY